MLGGVKSRLAAVETAANPTSHTELDNVAAQRRAEADFVSKLISLGGVQASQIQRRLRLDDSFSQGKREVNVILTTDYTIYCFLIRNWKGNLSPGSDGKFWIERQETEENVNVRQFPSPLVDAEQQVKLLHSHLMKTGATVSTSAIKAIVVFTNPDLTLPEEIEENSSVLMASKIPQFCRSLQKTWRQYLTDPLIPSLISGALSYKQISASGSGMKKAGTWDKLYLTGGRTVDGDFKGCAILAFDRKDVSRLDFVHNRNTWIGTAKALIGATPSVSVQMHKRGVAPGWIYTNLHSTVEIPYNVDVNFHFAGEDSVAKVPANEIESVLLS